MTLEDIVPSLELCKQIPNESFEDSALVWAVNGSSCFIEQRELMEYANRSKTLAPAPTLQEIIDDLTKEELCPGLEALRKANGELVYSVYASDKMRQGSAAEAALRLWLELI